MNRLNLFYVFTILLGCGIFVLLRPMSREEISFFGFAENLETEINYNYSVVINKILVKPGQAVSQGDTLLYLTKINRKTTLADQEYKISTLKAEQELWNTKKENELKQLRSTYTKRQEDLNVAIADLESELTYKRQIVRGLNITTPDTNIYTPIKNELSAKRAQREQLKRSHDQAMEGIHAEINKGKLPYLSKISLLKAEQEFDNSQLLIDIAVVAPTDGLIGAIHCKEEEHIPPFKSLLTFYEPHPSIVHGYVHEDLVLRVNLNDQFTITSLKEENIQYHGKVTGLGSRIVEIPSRLRKVSDIKTYGRKVYLEIPADNKFLQKEKVGLQFKQSAKN